MQRTRMLMLAGLVALVASPAAVSADEGDTGARSSQPSDIGSREITGTVVTTMGASGYTYIQIDIGSGTLWAAGPRVEVTVGDRIFLADAAPMANFYSSSLQRRFDTIYFASSIRVHAGGGAEIQDLGEHCPPGPKAGGETDLSGIERPEGGKTIAEIIEHAADLAGQQVAIRGKVVKCSAGILGRTWIHLRDGTSGPGGEDDLTVTTTAGAAVGDTLLVRGTVVLDRDFGYGYQYDLLIEDAAITIE